MDTSDDVREFLTTRRARITPQQAGLPVYGSGATRGRGGRPQQHVRPAIQHILDGMTDVPAVVRNGRIDVLAANRLGRALYAPAFTNAPGDGPVNLARFCMLDP